MPDIQLHTLPRPTELIAGCPVVMDVGAGIRPMQWYQPRERHICIEPHAPYCRVLEASVFPKFEVYCLEALQALELGIWDSPIHAVYMLDVIEHMTKKDGKRAIELAQALAKVQIVIYTPLVFIKQTKDVWDMGGGYWQTHRSAWAQEEFAAPYWKTEVFTPKPTWENRKPQPEGFYAIWNARSTLS